MSYEKFMELIECIKRKKKIPVVFNYSFFFSSFSRDAGIVNVFFDDRPMHILRTGILDTPHSLSAWFQVQSTPK